MDKCANCHKPRDQHHAKNNTCPIGKKHRIYGYTNFYGLDGSLSDEYRVYKRSFEHPVIGQCYLHKGKPVYIVDGILISNGKVKDWWGYRLINKDGTLGKSGNCHGSEFTEKIACKIITKVIIDEKYFVVEF